MITKDNIISSKEYVDDKVGAYKLNDIQEMLLNEQVEFIEKFLVNLEYEEDIDKRFTNISKSSFTCQSYISDFYFYIRFHIKEINPSGEKSTDYQTIRLKIEMSDLKELGEYITTNYVFLK
jgi:hypothetical protein